MASVITLPVCRKRKNVKDKVVFKDSSKKLTEDDSDYIIKSYNKMRLYCWRQESNTGELLGEASLEERDWKILFSEGWRNNRNSRGKRRGGGLCIGFSGG